MDGESSYESDTSESWSLIDINLNEESVSLGEACSELENSPQTDVENEKSKVTNETELEDFVRERKKVNKTGFSGVSDSDSDSVASFKNQGLPDRSRTERDGIDSPRKRSLDNDGTQDSGDTESIEILDISDPEINRLGVDHLDFPTYQSDDEESSEGKTDSGNKSNNLSVIKRRRRRVSRSPEDSVHSVNSENRSSADINSTTDSSDAREKSQTLCEDFNRVDTQPVYKHYRNNVANTILSLSVGVVFAGVACIAIGHFLGVQDAAETAVELVETLEKLQLENAALQSRLSHLSHLYRALLTREMSSKLELPLNKPQSEPGRERGPFAGPAESKRTDLNDAALSEIRSSLYSIGWLSKLQNFVQKNNRVTEPDHGVDFNGFGKYIHDQLHTLNARQEEGAKFLEDTNRKISEVLQKIITRLSSSQDHIEKLHERLVKLKNRLNLKMKRIFPEASGEANPGRSKVRGRVPVTELDLQTTNWNADREVRTPDRARRDSGGVLYKFPQPEKYYEMERDLKATSERPFEVTNSSKILRDKTDPGKVVNEKGGKNKKESEKGEKKHSKEIWRKKLKEKETKERKKDKRGKGDGDKMKKVGKNPERGRRIKGGTGDSRRKKFTDNQNVFNETIYKNEMYSKRGNGDAVVKPTSKKMKNSKLKKVLLEKPKKRYFSRRKNYSFACPGPDCFNITAEWLFKWAVGREEMRKHQKLGDWQFERAKARKELRDDEYQENWQFRRAMGRESNRNDVRWHRRKYGKYVGKDFFHEGFSWI